MYNQLKDLIPEDLQPQLRAIIPNELAKERHRVRMQENRRSVGIVERAEYEAQRSISTEDKAKQAIKQKEIAEKLGITVRSVQRYIKNKKDDIVCELVFNLG